MHRLRCSTLEFKRLPFRRTCDRRAGRVCNSINADRASAAGRGRWGIMAWLTRAAVLNRRLKRYSVLKEIEHDFAEESEQPSADLIDNANLHNWEQFNYDTARWGDKGRKSQKYENGVLARSLFRIAHLTRDSLIKLGELDTPKIFVICAPLPWWPHLIVHKKLYNTYRTTGVVPIP